jgi:hypothetical protein
LSFHNLYLEVQALKLDCWVRLLLHSLVRTTNKCTLKKLEYTNRIIRMKTCQQKAITDSRLYGLVCNTMKIRRLTISKFSFCCSLLKRVLTGANANGNCWDQHHSPSVHLKTCTQVIQDGLSGTQVASTQDLDCKLLSSTKYSLWGSFSNYLFDMRSISVRVIKKMF